MMAASLTLSVMEIVLLLFGAIILGITIHLFITSRKNLKHDEGDMEKNTLAKDEWKLKYFNDMEVKEKELSQLKQRLDEAEENSGIYSIEAEELRKENKLLQSQARQHHEATQGMQSTQAIIEELRHENRALREQLAQVHHHQPAAAVAGGQPDDYISQLKEAQSSLIEQNQKINALLGSIDLIKEKEELHREMKRVNEELSVQIDEMRSELMQKEKEIHNIRQRETLSREMSSMLDHAYNDFNMLQEKLQQMESQLTAAKMAGIELEDIRESHQKLEQLLEEQKQRAQLLSSENQELRAQAAELQEAFREANFQRQQLQKRIAYLEELNRDLQVVADTNKKLEGQLRRIGELESMLNMVSEERDLLKGKK